MGHFFGSQSHIAYKQRSLGQTDYCKINAQNASIVSFPETIVDSIYAHAHA